MDDAAIERLVAETVATARRSLETAFAAERDALRRELARGKAEVARRKAELARLAADILRDAEPAGRA